MRGKAARGAFPGRACSVISAALLSLRHCSHIADSCAYRRQSVGSDVGVLETQPKIDALYLPEENHCNVQIYTMKMLVVESTSERSTSEQHHNFGSDSVTAIFLIKKIKKICNKFSFPAASVARTMGCSPPSLSRCSIYECLRRFSLRYARKKA